MLNHTFPNLTSSHLELCEQTDEVNVWNLYSRIYLWWLKSCYQHSFNKTDRNIYILHVDVCLLYRTIDNVSHHRTWLHLLQTCLLNHSTRESNQFQQKKLSKTYSRWYKIIYLSLSWCWMISWYQIFYEWSPNNF